MIVALCILGYCLGIWIASFVMGMTNNSSSAMDDIEWVMAVLWPIMLLCLAISGIGIFIAWLWSFTPGKPTIQKTLYNLSLVFQPYVLGKKLTKWGNARLEKKRKEAARGAEEAKKAEGDATNGQ